MRRGSSNRYKSHSRAIRRRLRVKNRTFRVRPLRGRLKKLFVRVRLEIRHLPKGER